MNTKQELYKLCVKRIEERVNAINKSISEVQQSLLSETKSSAGDKHETGRAMLQLEREKLGKQLAEALKVKNALLKIDIKKAAPKVALGSTVYTTQLNYFIAISVGELHIENTKFYAISPNTPIGKLLMGKAVGDTVFFRDKELTINIIE